MEPPSKTNQQRARSVNCKYYEYDEKYFDEDTQCSVCKSMASPEAKK